MINDTFTWIAIISAGGGGSIITFITFWMALSQRIAAGENQAKAAEDKAKSSETLAAAAIAKCEFIIRDFNNERVEVAEKVAALQSISDVTTRTLATSEMRLAKSIEDVGDKIDKLSDTIIKTLGDIVVRLQRSDKL